MKSAAYTVRNCVQCEPYREWSRKGKEPLIASSPVYIWVRTKVERSRYIIGLVGGCYGCGEVYEDKARVLGNLLWKLEVKI